MVLKKNIKPGGNEGHDGLCLTELLTSSVEAAMQIFLSSCRIFTISYHHRYNLDEKVEMKSWAPLPAHLDKDLRNHLCIISCNNLHLYLPILMNVSHRQTKTKTPGQRSSSSGFKHKHNFKQEYEIMPLDTLERLEDCQRRHAASPQGTIAGRGRTQI